jgi:hypothetical protein
MEEEEEWERELEENITTFYKNNAAATAIIVDGTAVQKRNGLVMISGNCDYWNGSTSTEIYDSTNDSVRKGPEMTSARYNHASVALPTGDVAVFGGNNSTLNPRKLSSCQVFNVESNSFSEIGYMLEKRTRPAAILLPTGVVLIIGGYDESEHLYSCEFYDPLCNTFSPSKAKMTIGRIAHTASLLPDGRVLVCGGSNEGLLYSTTEIYDPSTDSFSDGPLMTVARGYHTATTLADGKILVAGGNQGKSCSSTEIYDPATDSFSSGPNMLVQRQSHFAALLPDGRVLIGGGIFIVSMQTTEIYDPVTNSFSVGVILLEERYQASAASYS